jgi:hypothetical protein
MEKQELTEAIRAAMDQILALTQRELQARAKCELEESRRVRGELRRAAEFRASLLAKYNTHLQAHGCK